MEVVVTRSRRSPQQPPFITGRSQSLRDVMVASSSSSADGDSNSTSSASRRGIGRTNGTRPSFSTTLAQIIQDRELRQQQQQLGSVNGSGSSSGSSSSTLFRSTSNPSVFSKDDMSDQDRTLLLFQDCEDTESSTSQGSSPLMEIFAPPSHGTHVATDTYTAFAARHIKIATTTATSSTADRSSGTAVSTITTMPFDAASNSNRSTCRRRRRRVHHHVGFGKVDIRTYNVTVGDHPSCSSGPPLWYVLLIVGALFTAMLVQSLMLFGCAC
jgi:hypothetical protein